MNIFKQYGIKEIADVCLYSIELDENDNEIYVPVLYMDTLKVSTVEESTQSTSAQGGIGNPKLITWDYGKDITVTLQDALFTPASSSMNWAGKLEAKGLQLYLRHFYDRNTDNNVPDTQLRTAILTAEKFSDFLIIPDRWPVYEGIQCKKKKDAAGYVGGTSIFCWMISGNITSDDCKKRVSFEDLILFYREQTQKWYFFNGKGPTSDPESWWKTPYYHPATEYQRVGWYDKQYFAFYYQYGKEVFEWIRENIANPHNKWNELEPLANCTIDAWHGIEYDIDDENNPEVCFLTQNLYIDGYRKGCAKDKLYSSDIGLGWSGVEYEAFKAGKYLPYRYFANIGVEYNTNIAPPQDAIYQIDTALEDVFILDRMERHIANRCFAIDTDENTKHGQYRYMEKYSETPLTVFIDPKTMQPFVPNAYEYYRQNGQRITGNLRIIREGDKYLKWTRERAKENCSLGKQLIIDPIHYPGTYRLVGETFIRDRYGEDQRYQFEIPLCKLHSTNKLNLNADGEPTIFDMKLTALRRNDGVMMKLTAYDTVENPCPCGAKETEIDQFVSPHPEPNPQPYVNDIDVDVELDLLAHTPRDYAAVLERNTVDANNDNYANDIGFYKDKNWVENPEDEGDEKSRVAARLRGIVNVISIDETIREQQVYDGDALEPDEYTATIKGSDTE